MRYVTLKTEEVEVLEKLQKHSTDNSVRKRSHCLLLSHQRRTITDLSGIFDVNRRTIERWLDSWAKNGFDSLPILPGRGVKTRLKGLETVISEQLKEHSRNLKNVLTYLEKQHNIIICKKTLQNFLKDTGLYLEKGPAVPKKQTQPE
ncbi:MAG: helix-turn-helix domain-containing protein [Bacteroidetes bacterium]|jgi:transposase|nr:helix-turn-helix domain-containing protein [Bacteroidota bacterium]